MIVKEKQQVIKDALQLNKKCKNDGRKYWINISKDCNTSKCKKFFAKCLYKKETDNEKTLSLRNKHKQKRSEFAKKCKSKTLDFRKIVIFSVESKFEIFKPKHILGVWRKKKRMVLFTASKLTADDKTWRGNVMAWGYVWLKSSWKYPVFDLRIFNALIPNLIAMLIEKFTNFLAYLSKFLFFLFEKCIISTYIQWMNFPRNWFTEQWVYLLKHVKNNNKNKET